MDEYALAKVSVDFRCRAVAAALSLPYVNLDSTHEKAKLDGPESILFAKIMQFDPRPCAPFYDVSLIVGVKIAEDTNGYKLAELLRTIRPHFAVDDQINVADYATDLAAQLKGYMVITRSTVAGSDYEGLNLVQVLQVDLRGVVDAS